MAAAAGHDGQAAGSVTVYENGPLLLRGAVTICAMDGTVIDPGRGTVALCRCGKSAIKPFCDGTHHETSFRASGSDDRSAAGARRIQNP